MIGYFAFVQWYYWGNVRIYFSHFPASITIANEGKFICETSSCVYRLPPKKYTIVVDKNGFSSQRSEIVIELQKNTEHAITLTKNAVQLATVVGAEKTKNFLQEYTVEQSTNSVFWKKILLGKFSSPVRVVSDEVGRGVWMVSSNEVKRFLRENQSIEMIVQKNIQKFSAQLNGAFLLQDTQDKIFWWHDGKIFPLSIAPVFFEAVCSMGENIAFVQFDTDGISVQLQSVAIGTRQNLGILEGLKSNDIQKISCPTASSIIIERNNADDLKISF